MINLLLPIGSVVETNEGRKYIVVGYYPNFVNGVTTGVHKFIPYPCDCSNNIKYDKYKSAVHIAYRAIDELEIKRILVNNKIDNTASGVCYCLACG